MSFDRQQVEEKGLINMPDCPAKFEQIRESLGVLLDQVERKQFHVDASPTLQLLYGKQPSLRGKLFLLLLRPLPHPEAQRRRVRAVAGRGDR